MKDSVRNGARKRKPPRRFAGVVIRSAPKKPTPDKACPFREPMKDKRDRIIAALTVEANMLELHAEQLSHKVSTALSVSEREKELIQLASEEAARAETIRRQIQAMRQSETRCS